LKGALEAAGRVMKHSGVIFVISDFIAEGYENQLKRLARRHDVVAISVGDDREGLMPDVGQILMWDPESDEERLVDTGSYAFKKWFGEFQAAHQARKHEAFRGGKVELLKIATSDKYADAIVKFFRTRGRRR
jgi:hypothetical protein